MSLLDSSNTRGSTNGPQCPSFPFIFSETSCGPAADFFVLPLAGLHIGDLRLKLRPVKRCHSPRRAASAGATSLGKGTPQTTQLDVSQRLLIVLDSATAQLCWVSMMGFGVKEWLEHLSGRVRHKVRSPSAVLVSVSTRGIPLVHQNAWSELFLAS